MEDPVGRTLGTHRDKEVQALRQGEGEKMGKIVDGGAGGKRAGGMAAGWVVGKPALRLSLQQSRACDC